MPAPEIHIESLRLHLRGVSPTVAQTAISSLGPELQLAIAAQVAGRSAGAGGHLDQVASPVVRVPANTDASTLRSLLARQVATTIAGQLPETRT